MKTYTLLLALSIFLFQNLFAQENDSLSLTQTYTPEQLREDLAFLRTNLEEGHVAPYAYTSKAEFDEMFDAVDKQLTQSMTERTFLKLLLPVYEKLRCSHSGIGNSVAFLNSKSSTLGLPFLSTVVNDRLYVRESIITDARLGHGAEILRINGMAVDSLVRNFKANARTDGNINTLKEWQVSAGFGSLFAFWVGEFQQFKLEYLDKEGNVQTGQFPAFEYFSDKPMPFSKPHTFGAVDTLRNAFNMSLNVYRSKEVPKTVILDMASFQSLRIVKKNRENVLFPYLETEGIENLIIDLRNNGGGSLSNALHLLQYLLEEEATFSIVRNKKKLSNKDQLLFPIGHLLTTSILRLMPGTLRKNRRGDELLYTLSIKPKQVDRFKGKIYLLVNGGSVSASTFVAANLQRFERATILGSETGGTVNAFQAGNPSYGWRLPHSQLRMGVPYMRLYTGHQATFGRGVMPDYVFEYTAEDILANRDLEIEKVYEMIRADYEL